MMSNNTALRRDDAVTRRMGVVRVLLGHLTVSHISHVVAAPLLSLVNKTSREMISSGRVPGGRVYFSG